MVLWTKVRRMPPVLLVLIGLCVLPELVLQGADRGLWGAPEWRFAAYALGGFWPGLLHDWRPNYRGQPELMFVTYGFLHAGLVHLIVNMMSVVSLGLVVVDRIGQRGFILLYGLSLLGGGIGFGFLSNATSPMVGASGALFGLAGGVIAWAQLDRRAEALSLWPVARALIWLFAVNVILWLVTGGQLAWQTHLGGFLVGAAAALLLDKWFATDI